MSQRTRNIWAAVLATSGVVLVFVLPVLLHGYDAHRASRSTGLVMHEWGTFTSFSGSDGVKLEFRPLVANDLPNFVMNPFRHPDNPIPSLLKEQYVGLERMETPVAYFYTDEPRVVHVRVDFPQGMLSEWFPAVKQFQSGQDDEKKIITGNAFLDWGPVRLIPPAQFGDVRVRGPKGTPVPAALPKVAERYHYGRARETDAAIVETVDNKHRSHFEKFLFYRGIGNFELPIKLTALGHERFEIANSAADASGTLLLMRIENDKVRYVRIDPLGSRATIEVELPSTESTVKQLADATAGELTKAGLYNKEALAMVNTWRDSWFGENGTRLLYLLPGKLTDELLPLTIEPAPDESVRVLVGRMDTLTPEDCQRLVSALTGDDAGNEPTAASVEAELMTLGRFAEPAIQFVIGQTADQAKRTRLETILTELRGGQ